MDQRTIPTFSTRLWSEEVGMADPSADFDRLPGLAYPFSSGRRLTDELATGLYALREPDGQ